MGLGSLGALCMAAGLHHDHRFDPCRSTRRRHEFARVVDGLDVEEDRTGRAIQRKEIEQVAEIDVDLVSQRDGCGETDAVRCRPFDQACRDGARLRHEGEVAKWRHAGCETGIELCARRQDAETVWADEPEAGRAGCLLAGVGERAGSMAKPGGDDDGGRRSFFAGGGDDVGHGRRRRHDHAQIGRRRQLLNGFDRLDALDLAIMRIDEIDQSLERRLAKISQYGAAGRRFTGASPHDCNRSGGKQLVETIGRHRSNRSGGVRQLPPGQG